jgi:DcaP outer membrane protein
MMASGSQQIRRAAGTDLGSRNDNLDPPSHVAAVPRHGAIGDTSALEARLAQLEAAVAALRGELVAARSAPAGAAPAAAAPQPADTEQRLAALEAAKAADGFKVGGTRFKLSGFVRVNAAATRYNDGEVPVGGLGKEFFLPQQIPVGGGFSSQDFLIQARQTRFVLNTETPVAAKVLKSHLEFDFALSTAPAGAQRATNAFVPTLRRAFFTYGNTLVGQEWSTFQNVGVLPETTDFVGPIEGSVFVRQTIVRQTVPLGEGLQLQLAIENPETETVNRTSPALLDNDDDRFPDLVGRLNIKSGKVDLSFAAIARELRINQNGFGDTAFGWGISAAGKISFGPKDRHDLRFMASYGDGIGRYLGLGFVPDGVFGGRPGDKLETVRNFAGFAALKLGWTDKLRSTMMGGYQTSWYPAGVSAQNNRAAWSVAGNLFWTIARNFDAGIEYRHGGRELLNGDNGSMDRVEAAIKYAY